ncbi:hypothetical protein [Azotosporobacter soli]|uniref:hypothetical protein n=1 Tax=Azotosporobacter soli TaxID=3055040 RepID=UPI0031FF3BB9
MKKEMTCLTFFDIKDASCFFNRINHCVAPVMLRMPNGEAKDLRFNFLAQNFLTWMDPSGSIPKLKLQCNSPQDVEQLVQFMLEARS